MWPQPYPWTAGKHFNDCRAKSLHLQHHDVYIFFCPLIITAHTRVAKLLNLWTRVLNHKHRFQHTGVIFEYSQYVGRLILCSSVHLFHPPLFFCQFFFFFFPAESFSVGCFFVPGTNLLLSLQMALGMSAPIMMMVSCWCSWNDVRRLLPRCFADAAVVVGRSWPWWHVCCCSFGWMFLWTSSRQPFINVLTIIFRFFSQ